MNDLERVTARAVECGIYGANKTLLNAAPRVLLAFERATLKEANETIERLKKFELTSPSVEALQKELADTKEKYDINEASNKAVELALEDVPYKGSYADGIEYLKEQIEQLQREKAMLVDAAEAVIARWDTPLWKDAPATAIFINELRNELQEIDLNDPRR